MLEGRGGWVRGWRRKNILFCFFKHDERREQPQHNITTRGTEERVEQRRGEGGAERVEQRGGEERVEQSREGGAEERGWSRGERVKQRRGWSREEERRKPNSL